MPKNKIQFQKGLSLTKFFKTYGTETQCHEALYRLRWPTGFECPKCGHNHFSKIMSRRLYQCKRCHHQTSVTSGTVLASTKLPLAVWFLAIYLITQSKSAISSLSLSRKLGISANAALRMKHKLQQAMKEQDDSRPLWGIIQLDDAYWGGKKRDGIRGRGASAKTPFLAAVATNLKGRPIYMRFSRVEGFTTHEIMSWAAKHLDPLSLVVSDSLGCFNSVESIGCGHEAFITTGDAAKENRRHFKWVNTMIGNVKRALHGTYHAVSHRHLPRYLAEFCYRFNRRFRLEQMIEQLAWAAVQTKPIPQHTLKLAEDWW